MTRGGEVLYYLKEVNDSCVITKVVDDRHDKPEAVYTIENSNSRCQCWQGVKNRHCRHLQMRDKFILAGKKPIIINFDKGEVTIIDQEV